MTFADPSTDFASDALAAPTLAHFADLHVEVGTPQLLSHTPRGMRRVVPITGGTARGDGWTARVLPGGSDFQLIVSDTLSELDARYGLETDAGDLVYVQNHAVRAAPADACQRSCAASRSMRRASTFAAARASRRVRPPCAGSANACSSARACAIRPPC